jgi:hypothetical protein
MKVSLILVASTIFLSGTFALAADSSTTASVGDTGIKSYNYPKSKMQIPPPPVETTPGHATAAVKQSRPEAVKTAIDSTSTAVGSGNYVAKDGKAQRFVSYLELKPGMENAPLTMHIANHGFNWFRLLLANQVVATEKNLKQGEANLDLTGSIQAGTNQVVVQAAGYPGATIEWKITTPAVAHIDKLDPGDEVLVGSELKIFGKNFSTTDGKNEVFFERKKTSASGSKETQLTVRVPEDAEIGDNKVSVKVNGVESNGVKIVVRGIPVLSGTNLQGVPPGQNLTIFGKNFSKKLGENQVYFDETSASVTSGDTSQLTVTVPFMPQHVGHTPSNIRVQVGKIMSQNTVSVQVGPQMYTDPGVNPGGTDVPVYNPRNNND